MDSQQGNNMPSLWVFLVIVLAVLLGVVMGTSCVMHFVQRRQRKRLERRIARGEVDLEILGIKRLNVPPEVIEKMPQYTFKSVADDGNTAAPSGNKTAPNTDFFQPTCSICLDDFVLNETQVRELPCKHIFHPECIDPFLKENSSLCPLCKRTALPSGCCPVNVTNVMVRRERLMRRIRDGQIPPGGPRYIPADDPGYWQRRIDRFRGPSMVRAPEVARIREPIPLHGTPEVLPEPTPISLPARSQEDTELGLITSPNSSLPQAEEPPPDIARRGTAARRAWRRERVASMHVRQINEQAEEVRRQDERRPLWRRALGLS